VGKSIQFDGSGRIPGGGEGIQLGGGRIQCSDTEESREAESGSAAAE
jgi:hypothetical protein